VTALTAGDVRAAAQALPALTAALHRIVHGTATLADGETVADDALTALAFVAPETAVFDAIAKVALALGVAAIEAGIIKPDPNPVADAETAASPETQGHYIGR
jgi:hypothetical protein